MTGSTDTAPSVFAPPAILRHPHIQSILGGAPIRRLLAQRRVAHFVKHSSAVLLELPNDVRLLGYQTPHKNCQRGKVILLHGWEGSANSTYMLSVGAALYDEGFDVFRLNFRDHGGTQSLNRDLFHSCRIDEIVDAFADIQRRWPTGPLFAAGFSLGGNFVLRVAARAAAARLRLERVVAICPVLRPHATMRALETGLWVYSEYFLRRWRRSLYAKAAIFPECYNFGDLRRLKTLTDTTSFFVENYTPYRDLDAYLNGYAVTGQALSKLGAEAIVIATEDDPVIPVADLDHLATSSELTIRRQRYGGHCGFLQDFVLRSWADGAIAQELLRNAR